MFLTHLEHRTLNVLDQKKNMNSMITMQRSIEDRRTHCRCDLRRCQFRISYVNGNGFFLIFGCTNSALCQLRPVPTLNTLVWSKNVFASCESHCVCLLALTGSVRAKQVQAIPNKHLRLIGNGVTISGKISCD